MSMVMDKDNLEKAALVAKELTETCCLHPRIVNAVACIPDLVEEVLRLRSRNAELFGHLTNVNTTNDALTKRAICLSEQLELAENRAAEAYKALAGKNMGLSAQMNHDRFVLEENIKGLKGHIYALDERREELTKQLAGAKEASDARVRPLIAKINELKEELIKKCEKQVDLGKDNRAMQGKLADQVERNRQLKEELQKAKTFKIDGRVDHFSQLNNLIGLGLEVTKNSLKKAASPSDVGMAMDNLRTMSREVEVWAEFLKDPAVFAIVQKQLDQPKRKTAHLVGGSDHCDECGYPYIGDFPFCPNCGAEFIDEEEEDDDNVPE